MPEGDPAGYLPSVKRARRGFPPSDKAKRMQKAAKSRMKKPGKVKHLPMKDMPPYPD